MTPELSICLPTIRNDEFLRMMESIPDATTASYEVIAVSPHEKPAELENHPNLTWIIDFGSPARCNAIAVSLARGTYCFSAHSDDSVFLKNSIDKNLEILRSMGNNKKNIVVCKYSESQDFSHPERFQDDDYYKIVNAWPLSRQIIPEDWLIFNSVYFHTDYLKEMGGYDAETFQVPCVAHVDLAIRCYTNGAIVKFSSVPSVKVSHSQPDHIPIELAQVYEDLPRLQKRYNFGLNPLTAKISLDNWQKAPQVWTKRFQIA